MSTSEKRIALVTGGNKGLGFQLCQTLAGNGCTVILTARSEEKGARAAQQLREKGLDVVFMQLDVASDESCAQIEKDVISRFGRLDILVNNAGIIADPSRHPPRLEEASILVVGLDVIRQSFETNTLGAMRMIQRFVPHMKKAGYGRIVNVSSGMGQISDMNGGWPGYRLSKLALNGITKILADELEGTNVLVNSVCPGWVKTDMGGAEADLTPAEGVDTIYWAATLPDGGPSGGFFRERQRIEW